MLVLEYLLLAKEHGTTTMMHGTHGLIQGIHVIPLALDSLHERLLARNLRLLSNSKEAKVIALNSNHLSSAFGYDTPPD